MKDAPKPPQASLLLRILGGGYLLYLAWDLRSTVGESLLFLAAVVVFALVGAALVYTSLKELITSGYFRKNPEPQNEESEDETYAE